MKKSLANQVAKLWNENFADSTAATATKAVVKEGYKRECIVEIVPEGESNDGVCFFHIDELAYVSKAFKLSCYVSFRSGKAVAHIH